MKTSIVAGVALALLAGCAGQLPNPNPPVPALLPETQSLPPVTSEQLIWQPGHWDWTGSGYAWAPGQWVTAANHGPLWMPGFWDQTAGGWVWRAPHWTS